MAMIKAMTDAASQRWMVVSRTGEEAMAMDECTSFNTLPVVGLLRCRRGVDDDGSPDQLAQVEGCIAVASGIFDFVRS
jgi:hypothetical protein